MYNEKRKYNNPEKDPVDGDWIRDTYDSGMIKEHQFHAPFVQSEEKESRCKSVEKCTIRAY